MLSNFVATAWDSHPREEMPVWPNLDHAPSLSWGRAGGIVGSTLRLKFQEGEMGTARDQSRKVLGKDLNWQAVKGVFSSDKFLSRQSADWQQGMAESEGVK